MCQCKVRQVNGFEGCVAPIPGSVAFRLLMYLCVKNMKGFFGLFGSAGSFFLGAITLPVQKHRPTGTERRPRRLPELEVAPGNKFIQWRAIRTDAVQYGTGTVHYHI